MLVVNLTTTEILTAESSDGTPLRETWQTPK